VVLRIYSDATPEQIEEQLGLAPTRAIRRGRAAHRNAWEFETDYEKSEALEVVIMRTLEALGPARNSIANLRNCDVVMWCAVFSDSPETTIALGHSAMAELAAFCAQLSCSVYATDFESP